VKYGNFDMVYMGIYSSRPWTFADKQYKDTIPYNIKYARRSQMNELLKQISKTNNKKEIWTTKTMLVNEIREDWSLIGYTDNMKQILLPHQKNTTSRPSVGDIREVRITGAGEFKLQGEEIPNLL
jgi:tRNA-2-methylthio-N6-dimethylallyladenosine synthase